MTIEQFLKIKMYIESIFNCDVVLKNKQEIYTELLNYKICFRVNQFGGIDQAEFIDQPNLKRFDKLVIIMATFIIKDTIKKTLN